MSVLLQLQSGLPRNAPGSEAATLRVLSGLGELRGDLRVLDIGCGSGPSTLAIAKTLPDARITAIDVNDAALERLRRHAAEANVNARITTQASSMHALDFPGASFDLIWCEGAIYIMGFANGLRKWRPFLKRGGFIVVSECTWLTVAPSASAQDFWDEAYPAMQTLEQNVSIAKECGYEVIGTYIVPPDAWVSEYYAPLEPRVTQMLAASEKGSRDWKAVDRLRREIELFHAHGDEYGYVFYSLRST